MPDDAPEQANLSAGNQGWVLFEWLTVGDAKCAIVGFGP